MVPVRGFPFCYFLWLHHSFWSLNGDFARCKRKLMYTLVHIPVRRVYFLSRRKDECVERLRRQL